MNNSNQDKIKVDIDKLIQKVIEEGDLIHQNIMIALCNKVKELLIRESNVKLIPAPAVIFGSTHGHFQDLLAIFGKQENSNSHFVFMGNQVDIGYNSVETFQFLICLKLKYPDRVTLLRGAHESRVITQKFGFYDETVHKYGNTSLWKHCCDLFDVMPLTAVVANKFFCVSGGLSPELQTLDQVRLINRLQEIPENGGFCDLLYTNPTEEIDTWKQGRKKSKVEVATNGCNIKTDEKGASAQTINKSTSGDESKNVAPIAALNSEDAALLKKGTPLDEDEEQTNALSWLFGDRVVADFNHTNALDLVARSNSFIEDGYKYHFSKRNAITVWSAPNYCYSCGNAAAVMIIDGRTLQHSMVVHNSTVDRSQIIDYHGIVPYFL